MTDAVRDNDELGPEDQVAEEGPDEELAGPEGVTAQVDGVSERAADPAEAAPSGDPAAAPRDASQDGAAGETELVALREEFDNLNDRHLRLAAEFNNFRRRSEQERLGAWARAQADLLEKLLDVLDDLHRVAELDLGNATVEAIMEGIDLVEKKFVRVLADSGVEMIEPVGEPFDPELMEALMRVPADSEEQADTVAQVLQKGYSLKGILIRPARVSVHTEG